MNSFSFTKIIVTMILIFSFGVAQSEKVRRFSKEWKKRGPEKSWNSTEHEYFYKWRDDI